MDSAKPDEPEKSGNEKGDSAKSGSGNPMEMGMGMMKKMMGQGGGGSHGDDAEDDEPARGRRGRGQSHATNDGIVHGDVFGNVGNHAAHHRARGLCPAGAVPTF